MKGRPILTKCPNTADPPGVRLYTQTDTADRIPIKEAEYNKPNRILGVYLTPSGDFKHQLQI